MNRKLAGILLAAGVSGIAACGNGSGTMNVEIPFAGLVGSTEFACGTTYDGIGTGATAGKKQLRPSDFRFYVSNVHLLDADGDEISVDLDQDGEWQYQNVALLDFEDGTTAPCDSGTTGMNSKVTGTVPAGDYTGICFDLGIPFDLNHVDVESLDTPSPLNVTAMDWGWQFGHKFVRIDGKADPDGGNSSFFVHLGSTGCTDSGGTTAPDAACSQTNIAHVCFDDFLTDGHHRIAADIESLLADTDISVNVNGAPGCMSGTNDDECTTIMPRFDLDFTYNGENDPAISFKEQAFFRVLHEE